MDFFVGTPLNQEAAGIVDVQARGGGGVPTNVLEKVTMGWGPSFVFAQLPMVPTNVGGSWLWTSASAHRPGQGSQTGVGGIQR